MWRSNRRNPLLLRGLVVGVLLSVMEAPLSAQKFFPDSQYGVDDRYIVLLPRGLPPGDVAIEAARLTTTYGGLVAVRWKSALRGFAATMTDKQAYALSRDPGVVAVYQNRRFEGKDAIGLALSNDTPYCYEDTVTFSSQIPDLPPAVQEIDCVDPDPNATGCLGNWGLDRLDDSFDRDGTFAYQEWGNARIYVMDTGVLATHDEFRKSDNLPLFRVEAGIDATAEPLPSGDPDCSQSAGVDVYGHGTHVAGIAGGNEFGVAKGIKIFPVRHFQGPPIAFEDEWIINAMECIVLEQDPAEDTAIINLSGLNDEEYALAAVFQEAVIGIASRDNLLLVQSAGNFYPADACDKSFGDESNFIGPDAEAIARVVVVAGSDESDGPWEMAPGAPNPETGTDLGPCVDLFAPSAHIVSTWYENPGSPEQGICRLAGTSMAAPHVSGTVALMLASKGDATAPEVRGDLLDHALADVLTLDDPLEADTPNRLVHLDTNRIFFSGFHHDLSRWWSGGDVAALSFCDWTGPPFGGGTTAYCVDLGADAWLEDRRPDAETSYDFYFRYDFSQAEITSEHVFFEARTNTGVPALRLKVRKAVSGDVEIGAFAFDNAGVMVGTWIEHPSQGFVRGAWEAGTSGSFEGSLGISPRGPEFPWSFPIGNNSDRLIGEVLLGAIAVHPATTGIQRFRQFRSWRDRQADLFTPTFDP